VPADLRRALISDPAALAKWEDITPLARNEWICWVISVKKPETRRQHIEGSARNLKKGYDGPVAGQAVLTAEIRTMDFYSLSFLPHCHRSGSSPNDIESELDD